MDSAKHLAETILQMPGFQHLELGVYDLNAESLKFLCKVLPGIQQLKKLDVCSRIGDRGSKHLSDVLPQMPYLQHLDLSDSEVLKV